MMTKKYTQKNSGFVILFAVTLSAIILSIALGVVSIALKEIKFGTSTKNTNDAFFAADTGVEYVLFLDKTPSTYPLPLEGISQSWEEVVAGLGSALVSCAKVSITKDNTVPPHVTTIISKGYNNGDAGCNSTNPDRIEREIRVSY